MFGPIRVTDEGPRFLKPSTNLLLAYRLALSVLVSIKSQVQKGTLAKPYLIIVR